MDLTFLNSALLYGKRSMVATLRAKLLELHGRPPDLRPEREARRSDAACPGLRNLRRNQLCTDSKGQPRAAL